MITIDPIYTALFLSVAVNIFFTYKIKQDQKKRQNEPVPTLELSEFMADLMAGSSIVKVTRISPNDIFLRSPRGK